jgi:uncharacterized membrane protein
MILGLVLLAALVVLFVVFLVRRTTRPSGFGAVTGQASASLPPTSATPESPPEILRRRYAAGEIDREERLRRLGDL